MPTPTIPLKRLLAAGFKKASVWGTAVALGANDGMLIEGDGGLGRKQPYIPAKEADTPMVLEGDLGPVDPVDFGPPFAMRYNPGSIGVLLAMLYGTAGTPDAQFTVDATNNKIDFDEGGSELTGTVASASYTGTTLAVAIAAALNGAVGKALTYTCTYSASTGKFTIGAGSNFTIRWNTGTHKAVDISTLCGYSDAADDTGASSFVSDTAVNTVNKHTLQLADSIYGLFGTFGAERPSKINEVASAKPYKLSFGFADGILKGTVSLRGNTVIQDSAVNTATQMDAITYADRGRRIKFSHMVVKMNAQSGGDVSSETALEMKNLTHDLERPPDGEHVGGTDLIIEPLDGYPDVKLRLEFPRSNAVNQAYFASFIAETEQKLSIIFTGPLIQTGHYYSLKLFFPRLRITNYNCPMDEIVPSSIDLVAEEADSTPTGMSYKRPYVELVNSRTTDYLA